MSKSQAELLFETYLTAHGYDDWQYEPDVGGKRPDYRLKYCESDLYFEVKEFDAPKVADGPGWCDLYKPIREKLNAAARQFKRLQGFPVFGGAF